MSIIEVSFVIKWILECNRQTNDERIAHTRYVAGVV